jgi:general secretion pathway protein K
VRIENESSKVNPNFAPVELLQAVMVEVGASASVAARLAAAISDWRTQGEQPLPLGAKAPQYAAAGRDYAPPSASFESLDELGAVLGMTPDLLARLKPHLTLYSDADPDGSTTDPVVAAALGNRARVVARRNADEGSQVATVSVVVYGPRRTGFAEMVVVRTNALDGIRRHEILMREPIAMPG